MKRHSKSRHFLGVLGSLAHEQDTRRFFLDFGHRYPSRIFFVAYIFFRSLHLWSHLRKICPRHNPDVINDYVPVHLCIEPFPCFPFAPEQFKASFEAFVSTIDIRPHRKLSLFRMLDCKTPYFDPLFALTTMLTYM